MHSNFSIIWGTRQIKNQQVLLYVASAVKQLKGIGVKPFDRVAICDENSVEFVILLIALWQMKAVAVPISPRWPDKTITAYAARVNACHLFRLADIKRVVCYDARQQFEPAPFQELDLGQDVTVIATSGSSGEAKAAVHTWGNHFYSALGSNEMFPLGSSDRWLLSLPLYHISGIAITVRCLLSGAALVIPNDKDLIGSIKNGRVTHLSLVSAQLQRLFIDEKNYDDLRALKAILLGGSAIPATLIDESVKLGLNIYISYGLTEMSSQVATGKVIDAKRNCVKVLPYRKLIISKQGEIFVSGEVLFKGYVNGAKIHLPVVTNDISSTWTLNPNALNPTKEEMQKMENSWFPTGDMGCLDKDGFLTVTGRRDNMFISGGENIYPEEIEKALLSIKGVLEVIVVPKEDKVYGQRPIAFIKYAREVLKEDFLIQSLEVILPRFKIPVAFFPWPQHLITQGLKISRQEFLKTLPRR